MSEANQGPYIDVRIPKNGQGVRFEPKGFGEGCHAATRPYEQALGQVTSDEAKPDEDNIPGLEATNDAGLTLGN